MGGVVAKVRSTLSEGQSMNNVRDAMVEHSSTNIPSASELSKKENFYTVISNNNVLLLAIYSSLSWSEVSYFSGVLDTAIQQFLKMNEAQIIIELEKVQEDGAITQSKVKVIQQFYKMFGKTAKIFDRRLNNNLNDLNDL